MRWPFQMTVDWVSITLLLILLVILIALTIPLWAPDVMGHLRH